MTISYYKVFFRFYDNLLKRDISTVGCFRGKNPLDTIKNFYTEISSCKPIENLVWTDIVLVQTVETRFR